MKTRRKLSMYLLTILGCVVLVSAEEISSNGWIRAKREAESQPEADPSQFSSYLMRTAASRIDFARNYVLPRVINGFIKVGNKVAYEAENFKRKAEPIVASSAAVWRRTVDEEIAPAVVTGLTKVGEVTVDGISQGADKIAEVVMGEEAKEETKMALSTISRAIWNDDTVSNDTKSFEQEYDPQGYGYDQQQYYEYNTDSSGRVPSPSNFEHRTPYLADSSASDVAYQQYQYDNPVSVSDGIVSSSFSFATEEPSYSDFQPRNDPDIGALSYTNNANSDNPYYDESYLNSPNNYNQYTDNYYYHSSPEYKYEINQHEPVMTVEEALYVLGKNILGRNVTDRIFPVAKQLAEGLGQVGEGISTISDVFPPLPNLVEFDGTSLSLHAGAPSGNINAKSDADRGERNADVQHLNQNNQNDGRITRQAPRCTTPEGSGGRCVDIQECPILLVNFDNLRKSICFKALFVPGVCCPDKGVEIANLGNIDVSADVETQNQIGTRPIGINEIESSINNFPNILPQGTTSARPIGPELPQQSPIVDRVPSISNLPTTTPPPSAFLDSLPGVVPGTNTGCGEGKIPQARIVGGNETFEGEYPWMVAIYLHGNGRSEFWCGGALVSRNHVVTAAHCTKDSKKRPFRPSQFTVKLGEWDLKDNDIYSQEFRVVEITAHPDFKANGFYNDVAIFKLDQPVYFNEYIQPICLPNAGMSSRTFIGERPVALGWGSTHYGGAEVGTLRGVDLPVWSQTECDAAYFQPITEVFLCAGYHKGGRDACQGDSGGPLMLYDTATHKWTLIGVISFGNRCAEAGYPGVFTRITHFMPWIFAHMT